MTRGEVLKMMKEDESVAGKDYLLVDLRRTDHQVCYSLKKLEIRCSILTRA
jgi:hypothetical protein